MSTPNQLSPARAVLARWGRPVAPLVPAAGEGPSLQDMLTWLRQETEIAIADECPVAAGRLIRASTLLQQQADRIAELETSLYEVVKIAAQLEAAAALPAPEPEGLSLTEVEAQEAFTQLRDEVLNLLDGVEVNEVLGIIDNHTPEWV